MPEGQEEDPVRARREPACAAPHSALYLDPTGLVSACCANSSFSLGRISLDDTSDSLQSIWDGARTTSLREALDVGDFSLGCHECRPDAAGSDRTLARDFDRYWPHASSPYPTYMDLALSNSCNLQCVMCNGDLSSAIRSKREGRAPLRSPYGDRFFDELASFLPHVRELSFKGGEPFLSREVVRVWDLLIDLAVRPRITVTTNGTVWNDRVEQYLTTLSMNVSISVDGATPTTVESIRVGSNYEQLWANVIRFRTATAQSGASLVLNYCLMPQNYEEFGSFLLQAEELGVDVHVVPVVAPRTFNLLRQDRERLAAVEATFARDADMLARRLERNFRVWQEQWDLVRGALGQEEDDQVHSVPVTLRTLGSSVESICIDLERQSGAPLLELHLENGVVARVVSTPWADALFDPSDWIGTGARELPGRMADTLGLGFPEIRNRERGGAIVATLRFESDDGALEVRAVSVTDDDTGRPLRLLVSAPDQGIG